MINLLPPDQKHAFVFARRNTKLRQVIIGLAIGIAGLLVVATGSFIVLRQETNSYRNSTASIEAELKSKNEKATIDHMKSITNNLNLVVTILGGQVLYTDLFQQVGAVMPSGSVLQNLALTGDMTSGVDLQVGSVDYGTGAQVLVNLQDPANKIFAEADLNSLTCQESTGPAADANPYPCTVSIRASFQEDSQFSFLKRTEKAAAQNTGGTR